MSEERLELTPVAYIQTDFPDKFGVPRQFGLVPELAGRIVFIEEYRSMDCLRGLEGFSHLWLIWGFSEVPAGKWHPTVRPPRLGGNERMGVFASRSPFRPNPLGISAVELAGIKQEEEGPVLYVRGADMTDGTPIYDIKPYITYSDSIPGAANGYASPPEKGRLEVDCPPELLAAVPEEKRSALLEVLALDPRPSYQHDPERVYGFFFGGREIRFSVEGGILRVREVRNA